MINTVFVSGIIYSFFFLVMMFSTSNKIQSSTSQRDWLHVSYSPCVRYCSFCMHFLRTTSDRYKNTPLKMHTFHTIAAFAMLATSLSQSVAASTAQTRARRAARRARSCPSRSPHRTPGRPPPGSARRARVACRRVAVSDGAPRVSSLLQRLRASLASSHVMWGKDTHGTIGQS